MRDNLSMRVRGLLITAIKGLRVQSRDEIVLERAGVPGNRRFYLVDERGRLANSKTVGELSALRSEYDDDERRLTLTLADGERLSEVVRLGEEIDTRFYSAPIRAPLVLGPFSEAISSHTGRELRLVEAGLAARAVDRGDQGTVSLLSQESLGHLSAIAGDGADIDPRRFRMLVEIDGVEPHGEDAWVGHRVRIGDALVRFNGHVGRCLITSRDPDSGVIDLPTLDMLGQYRRTEPTTEPLALGIYGEVIEPATIRVGDPVTPEPR